MNKKYAGTDILDILQQARHYNNYLVRQIIAAAPNSLDIVDFGAGLGTFAKQLRAKKFRLTCVETDQNLAGNLLKKQFRVMRNLNDLPDNQTTYLYSLNVLEHIADDQKILAAIARKLKKNGKVFLYVPALPGLFSGLDKKVGHYRRYTKKDLSRKLAVSGLLVDQVRYVDSLGALAAWLYKWFGSKSGRLTRRQVFYYDQLIFPASLALDHLTHPFFGKNLLAIAHKK